MVVARDEDEVGTGLFCSHAASIPKQMTSASREENIWFGRTDFFRSIPEVDIQRNPPAQGGQESLDKTRFLR
jgi:hypothetical protein